MKRIGGSRRSGPKPETIAKAKRLRKLIDDHKSDPEVTLKALAKRVGMEVTHFRKVERELKRRESSIANHSQLEGDKK